jgi:hypothetical protein
MILGPVIGYNLKGHYSQGKMVLFLLLVPLLLFLIFLLLLLPSPPFSPLLLLLLWSWGFELSASCLLLETYPPILLLLACFSDGSYAKFPQDASDYDPPTSEASLAAGITVMCLYAWLKVLH